MPKAKRKPPAKPTTALVVPTEQPRRAMPVRPAKLPKPAVAVWNEVAPTLFALGVLSQLDAPVLEAYCRAVARYRHAEDRVAETGGDVVSINGDPKENPWTRVARNAAADVHRLGKALGASPDAPMRKREG